MSCSLNVSIPAGITITWLRDGHVELTIPVQGEQTTNTIQFSRGQRPQPGVYQCVFDDPAGYILCRNITVLGMYVAS